MLEQSDNSCSASAYSDISHISGLSNISANLSAISGKPPSCGLEKRIEVDDIVGSEFYVSPEMLQKREYSFASDLWALGVIIFQMYTGQLPFKGKTQDKTFELI